MSPTANAILSWAVQTAEQSKTLPSLTPDQEFAIALINGVPFHLERTPQNTLQFIAGPHQHIKTAQGWGVLIPETTEPEPPQFTDSAPGQHG